MNYHIFFFFAPLATTAALASLSLVHRCSDCLTFSSNGPDFNPRHTSRGCFSLHVSKTNARQQTVEWTLGNNLPSKITLLMSKTALKKEFKEISTGTQHQSLSKWDMFCSMISDYWSLTRNFFGYVSVYIILFSQSLYTLLPN